MSNNHFQQTIDGLNAMHEIGQVTEAMSLGAIQAQATLALAYEQRTANLLAYLQPVECAGGGFAKVTVEIASEVLTEVHKRLDRPTKPATPGAEADSDSLHPADTRGPHTR